MCGRAYETYTDEELYFQYLNKKPLKSLSLVPKYNLCPTQESPVLRVVSGERQFDEMRWQLVPDWEPAFTTRLSTINAKSETIFASALYGDLVRRQRCIVPLSGFYEWRRDGQGSRPFKIHLKDEAIMSVAGVWSVWRDRGSFSILTTAANSLMAGIHTRMPVILGKTAEEVWLDPEVQEPEALRELFKPCPSSWLTAVEVSTLVNSPKNDSPSLLYPRD